MHFGFSQHEKRKIEVRPDRIPVPKYKQFLDIKARCVKRME